MIRAAQRPFGFNKFSCPSRRGHLIDAMRIISVWGTECWTLSETYVCSIMWSYCMVSWETVFGRWVTCCVCCSPGFTYVWQSATTLTLFLFASCFTLLPILRFSGRPDLCTFSTVHRKRTRVSHICPQTLGLYTKLLNGFISNLVQKCPRAGIAQWG